MGLKKIYKRIAKGPEAKRFIAGGRQQIQQIKQKQRKLILSKREKRLDYVAQEAGRLILGRQKPVVKKIVKKKIKRRKKSLGKKRRKKKK